MLAHGFEVPDKLLRREVRDRRDRAHGTVDPTPEIEGRHIRLDDRASDTGSSKTLPGCHDHGRQTIDPDNLEPQPAQRLENAPGTTPWLEHGSAALSQPFAEPSRLDGQIPVECEVVEIQVLLVERGRLVS